MINAPVGRHKPQALPACNENVGRARNGLRPYAGLHRIQAEREAAKSNKGRKKC